MILNWSKFVYHQFKVCFTDCCFTFFLISLCFSYGIYQYFVFFFCCVYEFSFLNFLFSQICKFVHYVLSSLEILIISIGTVLDKKNFATISCVFMWNSCNS
jgi:hypothetical protein